MNASNPEEYDLVVLGSGAGGKLIAWTSAQKGQRVVVIERKYVGGACPNIACLPSKNIIHSAKVASFFYHSDEFGISKEDVHINMGAVRERKRKMVQNLVDAHLDLYKKSGAELNRFLDWPRWGRSHISRRWNSIRSRSISWSWALVMSDSNSPKPSAVLVPR
jgi:choline dehydrogenase-like flavoprotein